MKLTQDPITKSEYVKVIGRSNFNMSARRLERHGRGTEQFLGLKNDTQYVPSYWDDRCYSLALEKYVYGKAQQLTAEDHEYIDYALEREYGHTYGSRPIPIVDTEKNLDSHPGFPIKKHHKHEREFFEEEGLAPYYHCMDHLKNDDLEIFWYSFPKNEIMKESKASIGDVRFIQCAPCTYTRVGAAYETMANNSCKERTWTNQCQVGWNPLCGGVNAYLQRFNPCKQFMEMDWTRYDGTIPVEIFQKVSDFRVSMMDLTPDELIVYKNYRKHLINRKTIFTDGSVVEITKGNPSGQFSTSIDNCMFQTCFIQLETRDYHRSIGIELTPEECYNTTVGMSYGDDRLTGYKDIGYGCNAPTEEWLPAYYKEKFGMWVKPENIKVQTTLVGLSFCGFTIHRSMNSNQFIPLYKTDKIYASLSDPANPSADFETLENKINSALILTSFDEGSHASRIRAAAVHLNKTTGKKFFDSKLTKTMLGGPKNSRDRVHPLL